MNRIPYFILRSAYLTCRLTTIDVSLFAPHLFTPPCVVKCVWEVFVWGFVVLFLSFVCVSVSGVNPFSVGVCACALLIFLHLRACLFPVGLVALKWTPHHEQTHLL